MFFLAATGLVAATKLAGDVAVRRHETGAVDPPGRSVSVDGLSIHYVEAGAGEPVVLIHGLGASTFCFRHTLPALATRFHAIALDLPGYGYSTRDAPDHSVTAQAGYVLGFLDALGIEKAALIGHSLGGAIAQRIAVSHPERVSRLVLIGSATASITSRNIWLARLSAPFMPALLSGIFRIRAVRRRWLALNCYDPSFITREVLIGYGAPSRMRGHVRAFQRFLTDRATDAPVDLSRLRQPTLLIWGEADRVIRPATGRELNQQIAGSRLVIVPRAGHWTAEERPDAVNPLLLEFLSQT
jgi:pimeloyl-ACP methyl ester carboxylesterase